VEGGDPGPGGRYGGSGRIRRFTSENWGDLTFLSDLSPLLTMEDNRLFLEYQYSHLPGSVKMTHPGPYRAPFHSFRIFATGLFRAFFRGVSRKIALLARFAYPGILRGEKPACLELV
jgi:hypothetical protein